MQTPEPSCGPSLVSIWIDRVSAEPPETISAPAITPYPTDNKENPKPVESKAAARKRALMDSDNDAEPTPRPAKRRRSDIDLQDLPVLSPSQSSTKSISNASSIASSLSQVSSHASGRVSPTKQLQSLQDRADAVRFRDFGDEEEDNNTPEATAMWDTMQDFADGLGILGYNEDERPAWVQNIGFLTHMEKRRLERPWANGAAARLALGSIPAIGNIQRIVGKAWDLNRDVSTSEDTWNTRVHFAILDAALDTSRHKKTLEIESVKSAVIQPASLAKDGTPKRIIDYAIALRPDPALKSAYNRLQPLPPATKSWNHINKIRHKPIAIDIETKSPMKSWTDGKPQIGIWTDARLARCEMLWKDTCGVKGDGVAPHIDWPAIPILVAQGHDWHFLIATKTGQTLVFVEKLDIGSTRTMFDALKIVAALHWLMDWAEKVWRPFFYRLAGVGADGREGYVI